MNLKRSWILGASEYAKIKVKAKSRLGNPMESVADLTSLGSIIMSRGIEADLPTCT
jgi:hypothetical protein